MMEGQRQLIELAPPMDPPAGRGGGGLLAANGSPAVGSSSSSRSRPVNLPGLSAGLAAISANYGGLFDQSLQQHHQQQQHRQQLEEDADRFRASSVVQHTQEQQHHNQQQQHQQHHQLFQQPSSSSLAPLMAAALCRPASQHFQSAPLIYSPYGDSQPSDPESTPTTATTLGCLSNTSSGTSQSQQQSPYAGAFSPAISLDPLGMVPWFWNWQLGDLQQLAYCPPPEHHHLLLHQNAHHLFSPPADLYLHPLPAAGEQLLISHSGGNSNNGLVPSSGASGNLFGDQFAGESPTTWRIPQKEKGNISGNSQATAGSCAVKRSQTTAVAAAAAGQMPRGQPRKGGRRPREQEDPNLTKDEKDRREKRRERNKQAAARCRRRREERMQTLEEQVAELQALNAEKEAMLQQLFQQRDMLMAELAKRGMPMKLEQLESMAAATSSSSSRGGKRAQTNSRKVAPSQQPSGRKRNLVQHVQPFKMEPTTAAEQQDSTPGSPPNGGNNFADNSRCMLVNGNDPVISSESTMVPQQQPAPMLFEQSGRENGGGQQQQQHVQQQLEEPPPSTTASSRPNYLQLSRLYKEGYMASTPSKDLATFGSGGGGHGGLLGTPGSEMITPGYNQIGNNESYGVLMAQQTGLTPCQHGPVPVLVQQQDGSERPPNNGELSELR